MKRLEKYKLKFKLLNYLSPLIGAVIIYSLIGLLLLVNINKVIGINDFKKNELVEALLYPATGSSSSPQIFNVDPLLSSPDTDLFIDIKKNISFLIFSSLFKENVSGSVDKGIVSEYEFKDAKELHLKLNNVLWHDGEKLTTDDVIFTLNQIKALGSEKTFYYGAVNGGDIDYEKISDSEMRITLKSKDIDRPYAAFLHELTFPILPKHILEIYSQKQISEIQNTDFGKHPIGSGKFKYVRSNGTELHLQKNENYFGDKVKFDKYVFRLYKNYDEILKDYTLKNVDIFTRKDIYAFDDTHNEFVNKEANFFATKILNRNYVLYFNLASQSSPFSKSISLRNALPKVLDRQKLINSMSGFERPVYGPIDSLSWAFSSSIQDEQKINKEEFYKRVESLGYKRNGDYYEKESQPLELKLTYLNGEVRNRISEEIKTNLKEVGVKVELNDIGDDEKDNIVNTSDKIKENFESIVNNRSFDALLTSVNHFQDPDRYSEWHSTQTGPTKNNLSEYSNTVVDTMLAQARIEPNQNIRKEKYLRFQRQFILETPAIYLINPVTINYYTPKLKNFNVEMINDYDYKYSDISNWEIE